jgi:general secretion pathway protein C
MIGRDPLQAGLLALAGVLTVSVAVGAANTVWHGLGHFPELQSRQPVYRATSADQVTDLTPIMTLAPFGVAAVNEGPLQTTSANLTLRGVVLASPANQSTALISDAGGAPQTVAIGETLSGGAVLDGVAQDHVILLVAGRREVLSFPDSRSDAGVASIRASIVGAGASPASSAQSSPPDVIDSYRQKIADNPQTVLDEFSVSASAEGYRVNETLAPSVRRAGLMPGDVIVRVNGVPVGNVEQDRKHFEDVVASGRARVEVLRNDNLLILSFPLR